jgi:hypothetical protein
MKRDHNLVRLVGGIVSREEQAPAEINGRRKSLRRLFTSDAHSLPSLSPSFSLSCGLMARRSKWHCLPRRNKGQLISLFREEASLVHRVHIHIHRGGEEEEEVR